MAASLVAKPGFIELLPGFWQSSDVFRALGGIMLTEESWSFPLASAGQKDVLFLLVFLFVCFLFWSHMFPFTPDPRFPSHLREEDKDHTLL